MKSPAQLEWFTLTELFLSLLCIRTALRVGACVMLNILGEGNMDETTALVQKALSVPGAGIHWYGKAEAKKGTWPETQILGDTHDDKQIFGDHGDLHRASE